MSITQPIVTILLNLDSIFRIIIGITAKERQNIGFREFRAFRQNTEISNSRWQSFENLEGNNLLLGNNNSNNLLSLLINTFKLEGRFNPSSNNNNNSPSGGLDLNVVVLVNALTKMNLIRGYFSREKSFAKLMEFVKIETEDLNE